MPYDFAFDKGAKIKYIIWLSVENEQRSFRSSYRLSLFDGTASLSAAAPKNADAIPSKNESISALSGNISFSSPQKFSNEKKIKPESQWHIKPAKSFNDDDDFEDKVKQAFKKPRNVVNLKN